MKLVQAKNYLLLIDENAELLCGDAIIDNVGRVWDKPYTEKCFVDVMKTHDDSHKIVAYYPLNKDCKELDLPMLPDPLYDENLEKRSILAAQQYAIDKSQDSMASLTKMAVAWKNGFETALTVKQFTLEDMMNVAKFSWTCGLDKKDLSLCTDYVKGINMPIEFIPKYTEECNCMCHKPGNVVRHIVACCHPGNLITVTDGDKRVLVGTYKY